MTKYVALLRGINVGGHKPVKMEELKKVFESMGLENVIEEKLGKELGHEVGVLLRTIEEIQNLADANPFRNIKVTPQTKSHYSKLEYNHQNPKRLMPLK